MKTTQKDFAIQNREKDFVTTIKALLEYIDAIPNETVKEFFIVQKKGEDEMANNFSAMPGIDKGWVEGLASDGIKGGNAGNAVRRMLLALQENLLSAPGAVWKLFCCREGMCMKTDFRELVAVIEALLDYIDSIPDEIAESFPTMPGVDRDWVDRVVRKAKICCKEEDV